MITLIRASLAYYCGLHALVAAGVAIAVAVLAGALLVGASVRASLRDLALARLGATEIVVSSTGYFREALAADLAPVGSSGIAAIPLLVATGAVTHEDSRRTTARVHVFGIDDRFLAFHGHSGRAPIVRDAWMSAGLAAELGAAAGDSLLLRVARPTEIPLSNLQGRREDVSERIRLIAARIVDREALGEFSLVPAQGPALSIFVPLSRLQQDLDLQGRANALLVRVAAPSDDPQADVATLAQSLRRVVQLDDLGLTVRASHDGAVRVLESRGGLIGDTLARHAVDAAGPAGEPMRVLTYLANTIRAGGREIPYSVVAALDLTAYTRLQGLADTAAPPQLGPAPAPAPLPPMWLNEWAASDLQVSPGERIEIEYFHWSDQDGLETRSAAFVFAGAVPMTAAGGDRTLTPEYPGITDASDVTSWDPPFPVDMRRVRDEDEAYWDSWRAAPKAFVPLDVGQRLWPSPFGSTSSIRARAAAAAWPPVDAFDLSDGGLSVRHARAEALAAAEGTTDFGEYFVYFSFFIVVSGLLLAGLFFALVVEQRARELGLLTAVGFTPADVRRVLLTEAGLVASVGSLAGIAGAIGYAAVIMHGLRTWWVGAVGTTALELHVEPWLLVGGAAGALAASVFALAVSMRRLTRRSTRTLLMAGLTSDAGDRAPRGRGLIAAIMGVLAALLITAAAAGAIGDVAGFFGAGGALLIGGCAALAWWLRRPRRSAAGPTSLLQFGAAYARWRPTRSVLSAALIAFACFVIVSVGAFRKEETAGSLAPDAGSGGFVLMGESVAPLMYNPNTADGRDELSLTGSAELERASIARFRLRPGDEASCLTLYQPRNPRIIAPEAAFLNRPRFSFARTLASTDAERANPWLLLNRRLEDGAVPAIADQTSLQYVFHLAVGDDFVLTPEGRDPIRLRIVGTLADSVLQSELIISEDQFVRLFPQHEGYRIWMIEASEADASAITTYLEDRLSDFGVDVTDTRARLAAYHQVENTYLSTFQALGALGLLLGTLGLAAVLARNVLERRRELGLLGAVGFTAGHLRTLVTAETALLVASGVTIGTVAALVGVAPALAERASAVPLDGLALLLLAVIGTGLAASLLAVRVATSMRVVEAIKNE